MNQSISQWNIQSFNTNFEELTLLLKGIGRPAVVG